MMNTHDEDAFSYFKHTKVECIKCPRLHHKFPTIFDHHEKTIIVDTKAREEKFIELKQQLRVSSLMNLLVDDNYKRDTTYHMLIAAWKIKGSLCLLGYSLF